MSKSNFATAAERAAYWREYQAKYRAAHLEERRQRERDRYHAIKSTPEGKAYLAQIRREWREENKEELVAYEEARPNKHERMKAGLKRLRAWAKSNPERRRVTQRAGEWRRKLKKTYGITAAQYAQMGDNCHICGRSKEEIRRRLCVDHEKGTRKVRGVLCLMCNTGIGHFRHDLGLMLKAMEYLDRTKDGFQFSP